VYNNKYIRCVVELYHVASSVEGDAMRARAPRPACFAAQAGEELAAD